MAETEAKTEAETEAKTEVKGEAAPPPKVRTAGRKAARIVGDILLPGASLMVDGNVKSGALHLLGGIAGRIVLGPIGWLYAAADSYSRSSTGKHFHQHFFSRTKASEAKT